MNHDISIIIVSWNSVEHLRNCLGSIYQIKSRVNLEVTVIDNASSDGSAEMVSSEFSSVILIENKENRGFAAANNQGIVRSSGRYILLLNPDTILLDDALEKTLGIADNHPNVGVLGCQVLENKEKIQNTCFSFPTPLNIFFIAVGLSKLFPKSHFFGQPELSWWDRKSERFVDVISGMFMLVRREAYEDVGLMDEAYFIYAEEADWCFRFWQAGWKCMFTPDACIIHADGGGKSTRQIASKMFVQMQKSLIIFNRNNIGKVACLLTKAIFILSNIIRLVIWGGLAPFNQSALSKATYALAGLRFHLTGREPTV